MIMQQIRFVNHHLLYLVHFCKMARNTHYIRIIFALAGQEDQRRGFAFQIQGEWYNKNVDNSSGIEIRRIANACLA